MSGGASAGDGSPATRLLLSRATVNAFGRDVMKESINTPGLSLPPDFMLKMATSGTYSDPFKVLSVVIIERYLRT